MELRSFGPWHGDGGNHGDVVMSCRVRLARNVAGFPFVNRASEEQHDEVLRLARHLVLSSEIAEGRFCWRLYTSDAAEEGERVESGGGSGQ